MKDGKPAPAALGMLTAAAVFCALSLFSGVLAATPGSVYGEGLAVMSARLSYITERKKEPPEEADIPSETPVRISQSLALRLISLSGFGGWDLEAAPEETEPKSSEEPEAAGEIKYPEKQESRDGKIVRKTYTYRTSSSYLELPGGGLLRNCTDIDAEYLLEQASRKPDFAADCSGEPLVLIMHTHTTESYEPYIRDFYDAGFSSRTTELDKSVAEVGERIAEKLRAAGIGVIHDKTVHDYPHYTGAYDRSAKTVEAILEEYPSVKIVLDIHRDAIEENGVRYAPAVDVGGKSAAQIMMIVGCKNVPQYRYNLRVAARLQSKAESMFPGLTRPILFDERNYNQELTHGSFLIEMGSSANSLDEALYSGELLGEALAETLREGW